MLTLLQLSSDLTLSPTDLLAATMKQEYDTDLSIMSDLGLQQQILQHSPVRSDDQKSVIKYLLSSPTSSSKPSVSTTVFNRAEPSAVAVIETPTAAKKPAKKPPKSQEAGAIKVPKSKKMKPDDMLGIEHPGASLKMKIFSSTDPSSAQVTLSTHTEQTSAAKQKKQPRKIKQSEAEHDFLMDTVDVLGLSNIKKEELVDTPVKKSKKVSKKKEKLIQDAISAAQQVPNLAALGMYITMLIFILFETLFQKIYIYMFHDLVIVALLNCICSGVCTTAFYLSQFSCYCKSFADISHSSSLKG